MKRLAVVGAGPSGLYLADFLSKAAPAFHVDVFDRLADPLGLLRYGVAPDHLGTRRLARTLLRTLERPNVTFLGSIEVGRSISLADLCSRYDATTLAIGAHHGRRVDIDGLPEDRTYSGIDIAKWLNGHPDYLSLQLPAGTKSIAIIGAGNVALDMARVFGKGAEGLAGIELSSASRKWFDENHLDRISVLSRSGPGATRFSVAELRELKDVPRFCPMVTSTDLYRESCDKNRHAMDVLRHFSASIEKDLKPIEFFFWANPIEWVKGCLHIACPDGYATVEADLVIHAIGHDANFIEGAPRETTQALDRNVYSLGWYRQPGLGAIPDQRMSAQALAQQIITKLTAEGDRGMNVHRHS